MAQIAMSIKVEMPRRSAEVTQNAQQAAFNNVEIGIHKCHVLGIFQVAEDEEVQPYFICEMDDGRNIYATPPQVRFLDTADLNKEEVDDEC